MRRLWLMTVVLLLLSIPLASCGVSEPAPDPESLAILETTYGQIVIEFFAQDAPKHTANFQELAREGFYSGTRFHRVVKSAKDYIAIQGGDPNTISGDPRTWGQGQPGQKTVPAEFSKTLKHVRGIVSAARKSNDINSATSQFFICSSPSPQWDGQYSIFGRVVEGMNIVDSIARAPVFPNTDKPLDPVVVSRVYLVKRSEWKPGGNSAGQ